MTWLQNFLLEEDTDEELTPREELIAFLKENLKIEVDRGYSYGGENVRTAKLILCAETISSSEFNIKDSPEYEG